MKNSLRVPFLVTLAAVLTACGGSASDTAPQQSRQLSSVVVATAQQPPAAYTDLIERIYLGFLGRPAEPNGLTFWSQAFSASDMPTTVAEVIAAYPTNERVRQLIDAFAQSDESLDLYTGNTAVFVNAIYVNLFNRNAEPEGRAFWGGFVDRKEITRTQAILWLLEGARNGDAIVLSAKVQAATYFTSELDTLQEAAAYSGRSANQAARDLLATITQTPDIEAIKNEIFLFISELADEGNAKITQYVGFNYLQNQTQGAVYNLPAYNARYTYQSRETDLARSGTLSYGAVTPQTIDWRRLGVRLLSYSAPITSNASLPGSQILPVLTMLCQPQIASASQSTDVLVARSARNLVDASQLAGQTFNVRRENCDAPPSSDSLGFDADGNAAYLTRGVNRSLSATTVSGLLSGTVAIDADDTMSAKITFSAYRYTRADGTVGYALVELTRPSVPTTVAAGSLVVWSQE